MFCLEWLKTDLNKLVVIRKLSLDILNSRARQLRRAAALRGVCVPHRCIHTQMWVRQRHLINCYVWANENQGDMSESTLHFFTLRVLTILEVKAQDGNAITAISTIGGSTCIAAGASQLLSLLYRKKHSGWECSDQAHPQEVRKQPLWPQKPKILVTNHTPPLAPDWLGLCATARCKLHQILSLPLTAEASSTLSMEELLNWSPSSSSRRFVPTRSGRSDDFLLCHNICLPGHEQSNTKAASSIQASLLCTPSKGTHSKLNKQCWKNPQ